MAVVVREEHQVPARGKVGIERRSFDESGDALERPGAAADVAAEQMNRAGTRTDPILVPLRQALMVTKRYDY